MMPPLTMPGTRGDALLVETQPLAFLALAVGINLQTMGVGGAAPVANRRGA